MLRADAATRFLVLEMGARGPGHIARLCAIAPPSIGVVLNVGSAHLGEFGSRQATAQSAIEQLHYAKFSLRRHPGVVENSHLAHC